MNTLSEIGNIPVDFAILKSMYPDHKSVHNKISELEKSGILIRLKKGLYVVSPKKSGKLLSMELSKSLIWSVICIYGISITLLWINSRKRVYHTIDDNETFERI